MIRTIAKYFVLIINLFFALLYLCGVVATVVPPDKFVGFAYFGLFFPILVVSQLFFVVFWLFRKHKIYSLLSLGLLLITFPAVNRTFTLPFHKKNGVEKEQKTLKLLTYNVSIFGGEKEYKNIIKLIENSDADVVCIQEFGFYNQNSRLRQSQILADFGKKYNYRHLWYKNQKGRFSWGVATFSKFPIVKKEKIDYESSYNVSIFSDIVVGGDTIRIFNNHLESNKLTMSDIKQYKSLGDNLKSEKILEVTEQMSAKASAAYRIRAQQARTVAQYVKKTPYPVVVCGDFNDVPQSFTYRTISHGLTDVQTATGFGYNYTFHTNGMLVRIDHVLVDKTFVPISAKVIKEHFSDHYPLLTEFAIQ